MGRATVEASRPPMWRIEDPYPKAPVEARVLRFGPHLVLIGDIAGISLEEVREWPIKGLFFGAIAFLFTGSVMVYYVFDQGARTRFLFGALILMGLAFAGLHESFKLRRLNHYELILSLKNGRRLVFASVDREDIQALALRIAAEQARQG